MHAGARLRRMDMHDAAALPLERSMPALPLARFDCAPGRSGSAPRRSGIPPGRPGSAPGRPGTNARRSARTFLLAFVTGLAFFATVAPSAAAAKEAAPESADPALEARMVRITAELRCLVCQNQTIADSNAALAVDLRQQVREALKRGDSERQVIDYMTARYGDFILYRPPLRADTALLWLGPPLLLVAGVATLVIVLRRRSRLAPDRFETDFEDLADGSDRGDDGRRPA